MNAVYKKMIAVINTIIASPFYRNPYLMYIKKSSSQDKFCELLVGHLGLEPRTSRL